MEEGSSTDYCSNCKRDIPSINYVMHVNHCRRNITLCKHCQEPVPTSQLEEHFEEDHVKVKCVCGETLEKMDLEEHKEKSCASRSVICEFCELSLPAGEMQSHKEYCGTRTEKCEKCNKYIKFRDLEEHSRVDCELVKAEVPKNSGENSHSSVPRMLRAMELADNNDQDIYEESNDSSFAVTQELMKVFRRGYGTPPVPDPYAYEPPDMASIHNRILIPRGMHQSRSRNSEPRRPLRANNRGPLEHDGENALYTTKLQNNGKAASTKPSAPKEEIPVGPREHDHQPMMSDLYNDYDSMSNLQDQEETNWPVSLQSRHPQVIQSRVKEESIAASFDETHLPCEFCDGMFPATDLILHQSGCQLLLLDPSSSHPSHSDNSSRFRQPTEMSQPRRSNVITDRNQNENIRDEEEVYNDMEPISQSDEEMFLPCEFCQVQLPVHALYHHQATCDIRPPSALPSSDPPNFAKIGLDARVIPRLSRPARPVHTRALDPDSDDERMNNGTAFNKDSTRSRYTRKQINRENDLRNGADYFRNNAEPSRAPNTFPQRSTSNDLTSLPNELPQLRENRTRGNEFSTQGSHSRPEDDVKAEGQLTSSYEEKVHDVRPKTLLSTAAVQKPQQKIRRIKENNSMTEEPVPPRSVRTKSKAQRSGNDVKAAPGRKAVPEKSGFSGIRDQPSTTIRKPLETASSSGEIRGKSISSTKENPRRACVRTFDLDAVVDSSAGSRKVETSEVSSRRSQPLQKKKPRKKIA